MVRTSLIYFCWVGEPQLQIYQGVFILSIAKALFPSGRASGCPTNPKNKALPKKCFVFWVF